jgi:Domain of unknown function (DUF4493)/Lamin Tail Domain
MKHKPLICLAMLLLAFACKKDDPDTEIPKGTLKLNVGLFISVNETENNLKSTAGSEDFLVTIYTNLGIEVMVFQRAEEVPDEIALDPGQYFVTAHSNNDLPAAFSNPYYYGESTLFTITPGGQETVTVNCELANTMVTIVYSDQVRANYTDYVTTVSTSAGSLVYTRDETRSGYFRPLPMNISVLLTWQRDDGTMDTKTLNGTIPDPQPKRNYEIHIDAASADGAAFIQINLDSLVGAVEIVNINDDGTSVPGIFAEGDLLITEIMYDPDALDDSDGEWFEVYNNTGGSVDLHQVVIRKNDTDEHVVTGNITIPSHGYVVLARTANAAPASGYLYGTSISLNNTGAILSLHNYGTDGSNGSLICSINYGSTGFPDATGASICLSPTLLNYASSVSGDSWCVSATPFSTGDLGTPGTQNDTCP